MRVGHFIATMAALGSLACHPAAGPARPAGVATRVSSAPAPSGKFTPPSIERYVERDDREMCGYAQLPSIPFTLDSVVVTPEEDLVLERLAGCFTAPDMQSATILLIGRAAASLRADCNAELGLKRSERVKEFLVGHGVPPERVLAVSAGDRETPTAIATPRVDFVVAFPKSGAHPVRH